MLGKDAALVTVPGGEGDYGVLAGHAPMITTVRAGVIEVYEKRESGASDRIFVAGGFAEVTPGAARFWPKKPFLLPSSIARRWNKKPKIFRKISASLNRMLSVLLLKRSLLWCEQR